MSRIQYTLVLSMLALILVPCHVLAQGSPKTVSLREVAKYGINYTPRTVKIANVVLEDVRAFPNDWAHLFQLYDPRAKFRRGAFRENENPCCIQEFSIFADDGIGKLLVEKKAEWINKRVNVYLNITDRGLTPWTNIGLVVKVERLNEKGKIEETLPKG